MLNCPSCGSARLQVESATGLHSQKLVCSCCQRFIKWLPSPATIERHENLKARLNALKGRVGGWDSAFINDLIHQLKIAECDGKIFRLSPRQSEQLKRIEENSSSKNISSG